MAGRLSLAAMVAAGMGLAACGSSASTINRHTTATAATAKGLQLVGSPVVLSNDFALPNNGTGWATAVVAYVRNDGSAAVNHASFRATILSSSGATEAASGPEGFSILPGVTRPIVWTTDEPRGERPASARVQLFPPPSQSAGYPTSDESFWVVTDKTLDCARDRVECTASATLAWQGALPQTADSTVSVVVHQGTDPKGRVIGGGERPLISASGATAQPSTPIQWSDGTTVVDKQYLSPATPTNQEFWVESFDSLSKP